MAKIGETINIKNINLLVLDKINENLFVIAPNLNVKSEFGPSSNYNGSILKTKIDTWFPKTKIPAIKRNVDFTSIDGCRKYGISEAIEVAPLTIEEYRKYSDIIVPNIQCSFWLATPYNMRGIEAPRSIACVQNSGMIICEWCHYSGMGIVPAFILDVNKLNLENWRAVIKNIPTELLDSELRRRKMEETANDYLY